MTIIQRSVMTARRSRLSRGGEDKMRRHQRVHDPLLKTLVDLVFSQLFVEFLSVREQLMPFFNLILFI